MTYAVRVEDPGLAPGETRALEIGGRRLLLCNALGSLYAVEERCSHAAVSLADGRLEGTVLECPLHGARFDVRDGRVVSPPARRALRAFPVRTTESGLEIEV